MFSSLLSWVILLSLYSQVHCGLAVFNMISIWEGELPDLSNPITFKSGGFEKKAQENLEIRTSNLETSKICIK